MRLGSVVGRLSRVGGWGIPYLVGVTTSLRSSLDVILDLLLLLLVRVTDLDALGDLSLLRPVQGVESAPLTPVLGWRSISIARVGVDIRVVYTVA
jgi:hypothetical protein